MGLPDVCREASSGITAMTLEDGSRMTEIWRLLDAQQSSDTTKNLEMQITETNASSTKINDQASDLKLY